jgi:hypothetical protein
MLEMSAFEIWWNMRMNDRNDFINFKKMQDMYKKQSVGRYDLKRDTSYVGESIEDKVNRIVNNGEPISDGAPLIYTERKDGSRAEYDIRTDRFEVAADAMDKVSKSIVAKRDAKAEAKVIDIKKEGGETKDVSQ